MTVGTSRASDVWTRISAPIPPEKIQTRTQYDREQQREITLSYISAQTVADRLDEAVPGEWDLTLEMLPPTSITYFSKKRQEHVTESIYNLKARLQILGVIREDVGSGRDFKTASSDAFKRVAVRFGIGRELYDKTLRPVQAQGAAAQAAPSRERPGPRQDAPAPRTAAPDAPAPPADDPPCPTCNGKMWDNRLTKRNPKAPNFKCRDRSCDGVLWPPREDARPTRDAARTDTDDFPAALADDDDSLPF